MNSFSMWPSTMIPNKYDEVDNQRIQKCGVEQNVNLRELAAALNNAFPITTLAKNLTCGYK